jgi:hypothetical protein
MEHSIETFKLIENMNRGLTSYVTFTQEVIPFSYHPPLTGGIRATVSPG